MQFQSQNNLLDAEATAKSRAGVIAELEATLTKERTTLKSLLSTLNANTPQVRQQRNRIEAIEQQLAVETKRLISQAGGDRLNVVASKYRNLTIDAAIAEEALQVCRQLRRERTYRSQQKTTQLSDRSLPKPARHCRSA
ncbi:hypothetical protein [Bordetella trematum]|uniref:hypothetical protein n=1 Tax=Bordetella trematum TaxID=123899 RepID=UPI003AF3321B